MINEEYIGIFFTLNWFISRDSASNVYTYIDLYYIMIYVVIHIVLFFIEIFMNFSFFIKRPTIWTIVII